MTKSGKKKRGREGWAGHAIRQEAGILATRRGKGKRGGLGKDLKGRQGNVQGRVRELPHDVKKQKKKTREHMSH